MTVSLPHRLILTQGSTAGGTAYLTFDDGPHPDHTPRLLDVLKSHGVVATFFVVGFQAERHPDIVRRIAAEGHALGHHSYFHSDPEQTTTRQLMDEISRTTDLLASITGHRPRMFRPPFGKLTVSKLLRLWTHGQQIVLWNSDPKDFLCHSSSELAGRFANSPVCAGDVVLFHDSFPHAAGFLPALIGNAGRSGITFDKVTQWT